MKLGRWKHYNTYRSRKIVINFGYPKSYVIFIEIRDRRKLSKYPKNQIVEIYWESHFDDSVRYVIESRRGEDFTWKHVLGKLETSLNYRFNPKARNVYDRLMIKVHGRLFPLPHKEIARRTYLWK